MRKIMPSTLSVILIVTTTAMTHAQVAVVDESFDNMGFLSGWEALHFASPTGGEQSAEPLTPTDWSYTVSGSVLRVNSIRVDCNPCTGVVSFRKPLEEPIIGDFDAEFIFGYNSYGRIEPMQSLLVSLRGIDDESVLDAAFYDVWRQFSGQRRLSNGMTLLFDEPNDAASASDVIHASVQRRGSLTRIVWEGSQVYEYEDNRPIHAVRLDLWRSIYEGHQEFGQVWVDTIRIVDLSRSCEPACLPDLNNDGELDSDDFFIFLNAFAAGC